MQEFINNPAFNYHYSALPQPVLIDTRLKDRDRRLLAAFYLIAGRGNVIYNKTRKELGRLAGMAEDVVTLISTRLVKFGWIKKSGNGGRSQSAIYELTIPEMFTHLQRQTPSSCRLNTTQKTTNPITLEKQPVAKKTAGPREKSPTASSLPSPIVQEKGYSLSSSLEYPNGLDASFANSLLIQLPDTQQQVALDEWLGQVTSYKERHISIHSPNGLFRTIINAILAGQSVQHASLVKQRRERAHRMVNATEQASPPSREDQPTQPTKRFAPGELKAKLLSMLRPQQIEQDAKRATVREETPHILLGVSDQNPLHFVGGHIKKIKPIKDIKTTTKEGVLSLAEDLMKSRGGGCERNDPLQNTTTKKHHPANLDGVGPLTDNLTHLRSLLAKLTSPPAFVEEPTTSPLGRGQPLDGGCPPQRLSSTSHTGPDALRLSHPHDEMVSLPPLKSNVYAKESSDCVEHDTVSAKPIERVDQKTPGVTANPETRVKWVTVIRYFIGGVLCTASLITIAEPILTIVIRGETYPFTRTQLLADTRKRVVTTYDENYKTVMTFKALPLRALLNAVPGALESTESSATVTAKDGHISHIPMRLLVGKAPDQSEAYLAVEDPTTPWLLRQGKSLGPFRLQWTDQAKSAINEGHWTYSIQQITITDPPSQRFPALRPSESMQSNPTIMNGFTVFQRTCLPCHTLNRAGESHLGPDLNVPYSPVEYFGEQRLATFVRDPQSLREWSGGRMRPIDKEALSDKELSDLIHYLKHMSTRKVK